jgi:hypothetical protein
LIARRSEDRYWVEKVGPLLDRPEIARHGQGRFDVGNATPSSHPAMSRQCKTQQVEMGANVLPTYARFARDLHDGTRTVADFDHAVRRQRLAAAIEEASRSGATQYLS